MCHSTRVYPTSSKMNAALEQLRSGKRSFDFLSPSLFDDFTLSRKDVRKLERTHQRPLHEITEISRGARRRWRSYGASGLQALEAVSWITGGEDGGVWVA